MSEPDKMSEADDKTPKAAPASGSAALGLSPEHENLTWLFGIQRFGMREGLEVVQELLARLGSPQRTFDVVLVGGTNGKGSAARVLAACLEEAGARTGLFTSPHLQRVGERALVNGVAASDDDMDRLVAAVRAEAEALRATFFEVVTAAALLRFAEAQVDVAVLEVGLGGRLDATNAVSPDLTVITGVALDHVAVLGPTVEAIAAEKAGILRCGIPTVTGVEGGALEVIRSRAADVGARMVVLGEDFRVNDVHTDWNGVSFGLEWDVPAVRNLPELLRRPGRLRLESPLVGRHQARNVAQGVLAALLLGVSAVSAQRAVARTVWPGRLERRPVEGRFVVLDGAHNQQAAAALAAAVRELEGQADVLVLGVSDDKDVRAMFAELRGCGRTVLFTRAHNSPRAADPAELQREWRAVNGAAASATEVLPEPEAALTRALQLAGEGRAVVVAGSLFLVAEVRNLLDGAVGEPYARFQ